MEKTTIFGWLNPLFVQIGFNHKIEGFTKKKTLLVCLCVFNPFLFCSSLAFAGSRWYCSLQDGAPPSFAAGGQEIALQRWRSRVEITLGDPKQAMYSERC